VKRTTDIMEISTVYLPQGEIVAL